MIRHDTPLLRPAWWLAPWNVALKPRLAALASTAPSRAESLAAQTIFVVLLAAHFWLAIGNWEQGSLPGCEFRQTQTALSALFIQREQNFSLAYPTPVLGKPWSIPMEFPLYEWSVVAVSNASGLPLITAGRTVTLACFYLALPAIYLLLGRIGLAPPRRLLVLGLVLTCPLYIFYSRSFLIESMALMFALWFFAAFVETLLTRRIAWLLLANLAGAAAGLAKVTTFIVYLLPAATFALILVWRAWPRQDRDGSALRSLVVWGLAAVAVPLATSIWWVRYSDAIKAPHPGGGFLTSATMRPFNFGWNFLVRFAPDTWRSLVHYWFSDLVNLGVFALAAICAIIFGGRWRRFIAAGFGFFALTQLIFPILYAWHDYYFYANAVLVLVPIGLALSAVLDSKLPRWTGWLLVALAVGLQLRTYWKSYYDDQHTFSLGGSGLTNAIRDATAEDDVIVIAGDDWDSSIPFYSQRRALMIRRNREHDLPYLDRAFADLSDESVAGLILVGAQRDNHDILDRAERVFGIDRDPFIRHKQETLYVRRGRRAEFARRLFNVSYNDVTFDRAADQLRSPEPQTVEPTAHRFFDEMSPTPVRYQVPFGLSFSYPPGRHAFNAHAPSRLWFTPAPGATRIFAEFGIVDEAYLKAGGRTDGVEFVLVERPRAGTERVIFSRLLDPVNQPRDRGLQHVDQPLSIAPNSELVLETRPGPSGSFAFDWAYWGKVRIK